MRTDTLLTVVTNTARSGLNINDNDYCTEDFAYKHAISVIFGIINK